MTLPDVYAQMPSQCKQDWQTAQSFLLAYRGSDGTFNAYRREVERLLHWTWLIKKTSLNQLSRDLLEQYLDFCQSPPFLDWHKACRPLHDQRQPTAAQPRLATIYC